MTPEYSFYLFAVPAVLIAGMSKGGLGGAIGMLTTPLVALATDPLRAAAIMLPVLIVMDAISLYSWRRHVRWSVLRSVLPGAFVGLALGWATAATVPEAAIRALVGAIAVVFALNQIFADWRQRQAKPENLARASAWGLVAGYTSFVSHAGGPPFQAYVLPLKMDKLLFAGTSAVFFAVVNLAKVVPYIALGQFKTDNLLLSAKLVPLAIFGVLLGVWTVRRVSQQLFYRITYAAMLIIGVKLIWDGAGALLR